MLGSRQLLMRNSVAQPQPFVSLVLATELCAFWHGTCTVFVGGVMRIVKQSIATDESVAVPTGEPKGLHAKTLCASCREALKREAATYGRTGPFRRSRLLCFHCYRTDLERTRAFKASGELNTTSEPRFQAQLPFEPVNLLRLRMLKAQRSEARAAASRGIGQYVHKQRLAQINARHALQAVAVSPSPGSAATRSARRERFRSTSTRHRDRQWPRIRCHTTTRVL